MCMQCVAKSKNYGAVVPGLFLVRATKTVDNEIFDSGHHHWTKGQWGLVQSNDPDIFWDDEPQIEPHTDLTEEEINALSVMSNLTWAKWHKKVQRFSNSWTRLDPTTTWQIVDKCRKAGWDLRKHGLIESWLFGRMGQLLFDLKEGKRKLSTPKMLGDPHVL